MRFKISEQLGRARFCWLQGAQKGGETYRGKLAIEFIDKQSAKLCSIFCLERRDVVKSVKKIFEGRTQAVIDAIGDSPPT